MTFANRIKIALSMSGILVFFIGIRMDAPILRWAGFGCVAVAFVGFVALPRIMRVFRPGEPRAGTPGD